MNRRRDTIRGVAKKDEGTLFRATISMGSDVRRGDRVRITAEDLKDPWIAGNVRRGNLIPLEPLPVAEPDDDEGVEPIETE
jgi:hypothetical protein